MADKKQTKVYLIPEGETRDSHTYHYTAIKTRKFTLENKKMRMKKYKIVKCKRERKKNLEIHLPIMLYPDNGIF